MQVVALRLFLSYLVIASTLSCVGCGSSGPPKVEQSVESNLKAIHVFIGQYTAQHQGRAPGDENAFRSYLKSLEPARLEAMTVANVDSLFISPRDGQPLTIVYNQQSTMPGVGVVGPLAYEKDGQSGKRFILLTTGEIKEVDQPQFDELVAKK